MASGNSVYLHVGGHRTGTSSLQMCLHDNRDLIMERGFDMAYPGRDGIPTGDLGLRLPSPRHGDSKQGHFIRKLRKELGRRMATPDRGFILSEENIPGRMIHFFGSKFYPAAENRMKVIAEALSERPKRVLFVVRSYEDLYVSAHRKRAEDNRVVPFNDIRENLMGMDRGWPEFIALMRDVLNAEDCVVLPMSARGDSRNLLKHLVPELDQDGLAEPARTMNLSATDAGMIALQKRYAAGETLERDEWSEVIRDHADDTSSQGFAEFTAEQSKVLAEKYEADCDTLSKLDGIRYIAS